MSTKGSCVAKRMLCHNSNIDAAIPIAYATLVGPRGVCIKIGVVRTVVAHSSCIEISDRLHHRPCNTAGPSLITCGLPLLPEKVANVPTNVRCKVLEVLHAFLYLPWAPNECRYFDAHSALMFPICDNSTLTCRSFDTTPTRIRRYSDD